MNRTLPWVVVALLLGSAGPAAAQDKSKLETDSLPRGIESIRVTPVVRAVRTAGPSVVNIQVGDRVQVRGEIAFRKLGEGSGVIVSEDGLVLTNWHVVRFKDRVRNFTCRIGLRDGRVMPGRVVNVSRENDLALLVIQPNDSLRHRFPPIAMGDSDTLMVGETVIAIGNPRGQANTVTTGVLSAVNRALTVTPRGERRPIEFQQLLQTDAAINPGNSGGALLDITGKLIGINTLMQLESQNIGFAIPVNHVRKVFEDKLLNVQHLGIWTGLDLREGESGVVVADVVKGGPADRARIRRGDRILQVGDTRVRTRKDFAKALLTYGAGQRVPLYVGTEGNARWRRLVAWQRADAAVYRLTGMLTERIDPRTDRLLYWAIHEDVYGPDRGPLDPLRVTSVQKGSPAADLGIKAGDLIVGRYDQWRNIEPIVGGSEALAAMIEDSRGTRMWISVYRPGEGLLHGRLAVRDQ